MSKLRPKLYISSNQLTKESKSDKLPRYKTRRHTCLVRLQMERERHFSQVFRLLVVSSVPVSWQIAYALLIISYKVATATAIVKVTGKGSRFQA